MKTKQVLVTGGTGYIGSHTVVELLQAGHEIVIVDDLSNSDKTVLQSIREITGKNPVFHETDLCNYDALQAIFERQDLGSVIHFAASKAVGESVAKPLLYYGNNLSGIINLLKLMEEYSVPHLIFSSSCTVYGEPDVLPVTEQSPVKKALSPYGNTKQICEEIISDSIQASAQTQGIMLRYFNPIGAHESGLMGENPRGIPNNLLPFLLKVAGGELEKLQVFGDTYDTPDGTCIRDYIHVVDLASAHVAALHRLLEGGQVDNPETFNIGTGSGYSVLEIINTFEAVTGQKVNHEITEPRPGDIPQIYADTSRANEVLGWKASRNLKDMLADSWRWQQQLGRQSRP